MLGYAPGPKLFPENPESCGGPKADLSRFAAREILNLKEDQLLIVDLGPNEQAARESATVLGPGLPDTETGTVVI